MNKSQLIEVIAEKADISKVKAALAVDAFVGGISQALSSGDTVTLIGFGTFSTVGRAARVGRNPKTGKEIKIAATTTPKFKAGKALKDSVAKTKKKK
ncbi:MAG: DNA-binding protein [Burkholderiales bacterium]|jgi:DNA-binding protein HU-beta|nr:DNA-binding protein [Burkholderiales bacterium]MCE3269434.1 DNA-binding protein [Burkholderiales bacterium]